jgi:hypothetical protein
VSDDGNFRARAVQRKRFINFARQRVSGRSVIFSPVVRTNEQGFRIGVFTKVALS